MSYGYQGAQPHAVTHLDDQLRFVYDEVGNMTSRKTGTETTSLTYDAESHLIEAGTDPENPDHQFVYDGDGSRVLTIVDGVTTAYPGDHYEYEVSSEITRQYYNGGGRVAMRVSGDPEPSHNGVFYTLGDHMGSTSLTVDESGAVVAELRYKAWGETRYADGETPTTWRYTGQRQEEGLGLYYYRARWYDPYLNRWIQPDTIVPSLSNPQSLNRYTYVNNNPLRYTDPSGHCYTDSGSWIPDGTDGPCSFKTSMPKPPEPDSKTAVAACGSFPDDMTAPGPNCVTETDPQDPIIHLPGLDDNASPGYDVIPVPYPGSKMEQAAIIEQHSPDVLFCFSAGVDSCIMYGITTNNSLKGVRFVLIGGGYYANYSTEGGGSGIITKTTGPQPFDRGFDGAVLDLAERGAHILIIYDDNIGGSLNIESEGNIQHIIEGDHFDFTETTSSALWTDIWIWVDDPSTVLDYTQWP